MANEATLVPWFFRGGAWRGQQAIGFESKAARLSYFKILKLQGLAVQGGHQKPKIVSAIAQLQIGSGQWRCSPGGCLHQMTNTHISGEADLKLQGPTKGPLKGVHRGYYRDNGKENGNYHYNIFYTHKHIHLLSWRLMSRLTAEARQPLDLKAPPFLSSFLKGANFFSPLKGPMPLNHLDLKKRSPDAPLFILGAFDYTRFPFCETLDFFKE